MLTERFERAQTFIWTSARLIDRYLFTYLFKGGPKEPVLTALEAYQNPDGGFGNALEPDVRSPLSSPVGAHTALERLDLVDGMDHPMVRRLCDYLPAITTPEGGIPFSLPSLKAYPHAPWWAIGENPPAELNPTAGIAGLLLKHGVEHPWLEPAVAFCWQAIESLESTNFHDLMPVITFLENVPDRPRAERELERLAQRIAQPGVVEYDPAASGYVKLPLDWAPSPSSFCRRLFSTEVLARHLAALAKRQQPSGCWPISWQPVSIGAEQEWRGVMTIFALQTLQSYAEAGLAVPA